MEIDKQFVEAAEDGPDHVTEDPDPATPEEISDAAAFEQRVQRQANQQFNRLKDEARAIYGLSAGRPGVRSPEHWKQMLEKAGDEIGNGQFIVRYLGAERYLEPQTVAVLATLRQSLISDQGNLTTAKVMRIDAAVLAYYNMLRLQGWVGNLSLEFEREAFGQTNLSEFHGPANAEKLERKLRRLELSILPLQERAQRMMLKSLNTLQ